MSDCEGCCSRNKTQTVASTTDGNTPCGGKTTTTPSKDCVSKVSRKHNDESSTSSPSRNHDVEGTKKVAGTMCAHDNEYDPRHTAAENSLSIDHSLKNPHQQPQQHDSALCLAVVRENGADVVVFDASGTPRTFNYKGDIRKLCFKTHGHEIADDLLTPCFDEDGNHGSPEEDCFCGVDTPHLHAHIYNPRTCSKNEDAKSNPDSPIGYLASQTLHPTSDDSPMARIGVSDRMPRECNSEEIVRESSSGAGTAGTNKHPNWRRLHQVQHDDHVDYLVHNNKTGNMHLEHACSDCGSADVHGAFQSMGQRRLKRSAHDIQLQFFEVAPRPFSILEYIHSAFELKSDRVAAATMESPSTPRRAPVARRPSTQNAAAIAPDDSTKKKKAIVSSTLHCSRICCASECPIIKKILTPVPGVENILINVPLKQVIVKHDALTVSAADLEKALNKENMGANVRRDGAMAAGISAIPSTAQTTGRSQFYVANICCASEIPYVRSIVEPLEGVKSVSINTTTKVVYVDHTISVLSARDICNALNDDGFDALIRFDAATSATSARATFVQSTLSLETDMEPDTGTLTSFMHDFDSSQMESFFVDVPSGRITVLHNPFCLTAERVVELLQKETGLVATVTVDGADPENWNFPTLVEDTVEGIEEDESFTYPRPAVMLSGVCWIVSMLHFVGGDWDYLKYVGLVSVAFGLPPIALKAFRTLVRFQFDTNCLMLFAAIGAVALQEFAEAAAVVFLFAISEWLEVRATSRARRALSAIVHLRPDRANLIHPTTRELITVPAASVPVGAMVSVRTGDKIPCDGVVVEGTSTVDESSLTGESRPIRKGPEDKVSGGTINSGLSELVVKTTATTENSAVSRLIRLVEEAQANRSETEKMIDEFARWYTPIIVFAAVLMCSIPWAFGEDTGREWTFNGLILIVVACPCAMIISTPVSYVAGLAASAQKGILIKGGATLEALGVVKNICFDKTGTLTNGEFTVLHLRTVPNSLPRNEVLQYLSLMEERASHPVAQALVAAARNEQVTVPDEMILEKHRIVAGEGVEGVVNGLAVSVGNERLFERLDLLGDLEESIKADAESWKMLGGTVGFMSVEGHGIVCGFCAADGVREESARVLAKLRKNRFNMIMLTGDNADAAIAIGRQVGLSSDQIKSKLLPEEKLKFIEDLSCDDHSRSGICVPCSSKDVTLMCGDGVNDAPALAAADIGVAMGAGAALAMETADVTLLDSNLEKLAYSIDMGRRVIRKIKENVIFSVAVKFLVLGFALAGKTHLWAAIGSDVGAMILVTLNSMSLLPRRQRRRDVLALQGDIEQGTSGRQKGLSKQASSSTLAVSAPNEPPQKQPSCEKGGCAKGAPASGPVKKSTDCKKGCCSKSGKIEKSKPGEEAVNPSSGCPQGCCSKSAKYEAEAEGSCSKKPLTSEPVKTSKPCQKGCCSQYDEVELSHSDDDHEEGVCSKKGSVVEHTGTKSDRPKECCSKNATDGDFEAACCSKKKLAVEHTTGITASDCEKGCCSKSTAVGDSSKQSAVPSGGCSGANRTCGSRSKKDGDGGDKKDCCDRNESGVGGGKDCCSNHVD